MTLFYFSISLTIGASMLYHFSQKQIPAGVNPIVSVILTYALSLLLCIGLLFFEWPKDGVWHAFRQLNWASYVLALSLIGLELGFLLAYRAGWDLGLAAVVVNVAASLMLIPVSIFLFRSHISRIIIAGIFVCLIGLIMLNWKR